MFAFEATGALVLFLAMAVLAIYLYGRSCYSAGFEDGRAAAYGRKLAAARAERGRHAKSQPRAFPSPAPAAVPAERSRTSLVRSGYRDSWRGPGPVELPRGGAIGVFLERQGRPTVTAADIPPVFLPPQPAPDKNGADDTGTMPRVRLDRGDTGEMRAVTSAWIAENCPGAEEAEAIA